MGYIFLCILVGLAFAFGLYYRSKSLGDKASRIQWILGGLRFLSVTLICLLLLEPVLKARLTETKKPLVVLAQDNSASIAAGTDSTTRQQLQRAFTQLRETLAEDYDVRTYNFGTETTSELPFSFEAPATNLSNFFTSIYDLFAGQPLGAVILASDGIFNQGSHPLYQSERLTAPIYSIALGDTTPKRDLVLKKLYSNRIAYLDDKFTVQIDVTATNAAGANTTLLVEKVRNNGQTQTLQRIPINIGDNDFFQTKEIILDAAQAGIQHYRFSLLDIPQEHTTNNNQKDLYIEVLDNRQKILLLANAPHPDISALKQVVETQKNYALDVEYAGTFSGSVKEYDLVILHQLPSQVHPITNVLNALKRTNTARLFIVGLQSNLASLNKQQQAATLRGNLSQTSDAQARFNTQFNLFNLSEETQKLIPRFPPLTTPFGDFASRGNAQNILYQRLGALATEDPLLVLQEDNDTRVGVLFGEGIWRWRVFNYLENENFQAFDELMSKTIQYLSIREDKRKFRAFASRTIYSENEAILLDAELYNASYELINTPDAQIEITDDAGKSYPFVFNKTAKAYTLDAGYFSEGNYNFTATCTHNGQEYTAKGAFSVQPIQLEVFETTADHRLLQLLSTRNGGEMLFVDQIESLPNKLAQLPSMKPTLYETLQTRSLIHWRWLCGLLLALLATEWFIRRYRGGY